MDSPSFKTDFPRTAISPPAEKLLIPARVALLRLHKDSSQHGAPRLWREDATSTTGALPPGHRPFAVRCCKHLRNSSSRTMSTLPQPGAHHPGIHQRRHLSSPGKCRSSRNPRDAFRRKYFRRHPARPAVVIEHDELAPPLQQRACRLIHPLVSPILIDLPR